MTIREQHQLMTATRRTIEALHQVWPLLEQGFPEIAREHDQERRRLSDVLLSVNQTICAGELARRLGVSEAKK